ncbi:MAG TPA: hypothetical protein VLA72_15295 [Anaerolineales bacterium]|nr:hypothetical protein [Anaerolineales bacterium]
MKRLFSILFFFSITLLITACTTSPVPEMPEQPVEPTPTLFPPTLSPPEINAPLVESPALTSIQFLNSTDGWGVSETQIVRTNDGGVTWYNVTPIDITEAGYAIDLFVLDNDHVWMQVPDFGNYPNSGFQYRTTDGGLTWSMANVPFSRGDIKFLDVNNGWALADLGIGAGSNAVAVYQTTNSGVDWSLSFINDPNNANAGDSLPLGGLKFGITPLDMNSAWVHGVVYAPGTAYLYRSNDAGRFWELVSIPLPPGTANADLPIEQIEFATASDAFLTMRISSDSPSLAIYVSKDGGETWSLTPMPIPDGNLADIVSAEEIVIYNGSQFFVTRDAAQTWNSISPDVVFGDTFAAMDFVAVSTGWVITLDPTTGHRALYKTADGGATWFPVVR